MLRLAAILALFVFAAGCSKEQPVAPPPTPQPIPQPPELIILDPRPVVPSAGTGEIIAALGDTRELIAVNAESGTTRTLASEGWVTEVALTADASAVVFIEFVPSSSPGRYGTYRVTRASMTGDPDPRPLATFAFGYSIRNLAVSPRSGLVACSRTYRDSLFVLSASDGSKRHLLRGMPLAFSPEGDRLAARLAPEVIEIHDLASGTSTILPVPGVTMPLATLWNEHGLRLFSFSGSARNLVLHEPLAGTSRVVWSPSGAMLAHTLCWASDGSRVAMWTMRRAYRTELYVIDLATGRSAIVATRDDLPAWAVKGACFGPDDSRIFTNIGGALIETPLPPLAAAP